MSDYPHYDAQDWNTLQFQVFEIWPHDPRQRHFRTLMQNYYENIYLKHIEKKPTKTPAPKNFWPYSFQFYMCNPVRTFHCVVTEALEDPQVEILEYVEPLDDREQVDPMPMPVSVLNAHEKRRIQGEIGVSAFDVARSAGLDADQRLSLSLRDTDHATPQSGLYRRGAR